MQWKNGFTLNADHNTSIALMLHGSWHDADNMFGTTQYDVTQKNGYAQLMFETDITENHNVSLGASFNPTTMTNVSTHWVHCLKQKAR